MAALRKVMRNSGNHHTDTPRHENAPVLLFPFSSEKPMLSSESIYLSDFKRCRSVETGRERQ
jgi:hypothetical protein